MANNKGRKGETRLIRLVCDIMDTEESTDFTRHTNTNTADGGADIVLEHPREFYDRLLDIASVESRSEPKTSNPDTRVKSRIDNKNYNGKLDEVVVNKFGGDIRKNPDCEGHLLAGGEGLTRGGKIALKNLQSAHPKKRIDYIDESGLKKIESHYQTLPEPERGQSDNDDL